MNAFGFRADQKITDFIKSHKFTLSAEIIPPRNGTEQRAVLNQVEQLIKHGSQFLSVTKGAGGSLRGGSLPIAQTVKENFGVPCVAHFTCRDLTPHEVENQLIDHHYFGIRNILALRGDPPMGQTEWVSKPGSHEYAYQLIEQIRKLNHGQYLVRDGYVVDHEGIEKTDFCIGAAVYPEHPNPKERGEFFKQKIDAGAEYAISQMVFDVDAYADFLEQCAKMNINVPILPGTRILKSKKQAATMASRFQVSVPKWLMDRLPDSTTSKSTDPEIQDLFGELIEKFRKRGAPGVHLFVLSDTDGSCQLISKLAK